jgi:hypothetical protein
LVAVRYFLLTFDQHAGRILLWEEFDEGQSDVGVKRRFELEVAHRHDPNVEVVLLGAPSLAQLKATHSRYFLSPDQILVGG